MNNLTVVLAVFNEEENLDSCLRSIQNIASEIVIVDGGSKDKTLDIARNYSAKIIKTNNPPIFHINKQKALNEVSSPWILQLDADERVSKKLADEILKVIKMSDSEIEEYQQKLENKKLFLKHQELLDKRYGKIGLVRGEYSAFFLPRKNYFLGKFLKYGGVYPDGVIRLLKKGKGYFPCKSVHEQIVIQGKVGWLQNDLLHIDSPNFSRYLKKNSKYIDLIVDELRKEKLSKNFLNFIKFIFFKPLYWFLLTFIFHKGILDGFQGLVFSLFSSFRFPRAYLRYLKS